MLLVADLANTKCCKKPDKWLKHWHMDTHLRVLTKSFPVNTNETGFGWFSKNPCVFELWMKVASAMEGLSQWLFDAHKKRLVGESHNCLSWTTCNYLIIFTKQPPKTAFLPPLFLSSVFLVINHSWSDGDGWVVCHRRLTILDRDWGHRQVFIYFFYILDEIFFFVWDMQ